MRQQTKLGTASVARNSSSGLEAKAKLGCHLLAIVAFVALLVLAILCQSAATVADQSRIQVSSPPAQAGLLK